MALDEPKDNDSIYEFESQKFVVEKGLIESLGKLKVDFMDDGFRSGLMITSEKPIAGGGKSGCGGSCKC
ncbi:MAG: hypothetical protein HZA20_09255 [Nitrospirae bacterium]|nr:hypothetical protein [Nitrospirota bacterium]